MAVLLRFSFNFLLHYNYILIPIKILCKFLFSFLSISDSYYICLFNATITKNKISLYIEPNYLLWFLINDPELVRHVFRAIIKNVMLLILATLQDCPFNVSESVYNECKQININDCYLIKDLTINCTNQKINDSLFIL